MDYQEEYISRINKVLTTGLELEKVLTDHKMEKEASMVRQMTSRFVLQALVNHETRGKVICRCGRWLRNGMEIEFYKNVCSCYSCDSSYIDSLEDIQ